jgi:hypothetical protein
MAWLRPKAPSFRWIDFTCVLIVCAPFVHNLSLSVWGVTAAWEQNGSGDRPSGAVRRAQARSSCPHRCPLTCTNAADQRLRGLERSVRD